MTAFKELGLSEQIQTAIDELGFEEPTPVQEQVIPELLAGHDVIGRFHLVAAAAEDEVLAGLDADEREQFGALVARVLRHASAAEGP